MTPMIERRTRFPQTRCCRKFCDSEIFLQTCKSSTKQLPRPLHAKGASLHCARTVRYFQTSFPAKSPKAHPFQRPLKLGHPIYHF